MTTTEAVNYERACERAQAETALGLPHGKLYLDQLSMALHSSSDQRALAWLDIDKKKRNNTNKEAFMKLCKDFPPHFVPLGLLPLRLPR